MSEGYLKIIALTGDNTVPLQGAKITITNSNDQIVSTNISNEIGSTALISLPAPDKTLTLDQNYKGATYSQYSVEIQLAGYVPIIYSGVQIFDGQTSILRVQMIPSPLNMPQEDKVIKFNITPINI